MTVEAYQVLEKAITNWAEGIAVGLACAWQAILNFTVACRDVIWGSYEQAGMPYGASDEGMWRWAWECAKAERLRREAEEIELYHQQMATFRKMVEERKAQ